MTVTAKNMRKVISGTGWSNPLTHNVYLESTSHLKVYSDDELLVSGVDYTVDELLNEAGYEVTIASFDPGEEPDWYDPTVWVLSVEPPINQPSDVSLGGTFGARFEEALDTLTRRMQHIYDMALRSLKTPLTEDPATLSQGDLVLNVEDLADLAAAVAAAEAAADSAEDDAAAADADRVTVAADKAIVAADKAIVAADKATVAADKVIVAADKATVAADKATVAADKATVASDKGIVLGYRDEVEADRADVQADKVIASAAADDAVAAQVAAEAALALTLAAYDNFDDRYLGAKASEPTLDNDGNALVGGMLFYHTGVGMKVYTGSAWEVAYVSGGSYAVLANNGSDYTASTFRTNLDLYSTGQVDTLLAAKQATSAGLTALIAAWAVATTTIGAKLKFLEGTNNGAHGVTLKAPDSVAADVDVELPGVAGTLALLSQVIGAAMDYIPAADFCPPITNGAQGGIRILASNGQALFYYAFDTATQEILWVKWFPRKRYDGGAIAFAPIWTAESGSGTVDFKLSGVAVSNDDALDAAPGTAQASTDTLLSAGDLHEGPTSSAITLAGTFADGDGVWLKLVRDVANDTLGVDAQLLGIKIFYNTDQANDA